MIKLKPCPFCGSEPEIRTNTFFGTEKYYIACANLGCPVRPFTNLYKVKAYAAKEAWNKRAEVNEND